jgi:carbamoyl-phosphate synthase small subunit
VTVPAFGLGEKLNDPLQMYLVDAFTLPANLRATHVSLFDGTLQGLARTDKPAFCFQGHPEASPGPHDIGYLFDRFVKLMEER